MTLMDTSDANHRYSRSSETYTKLAVQDNFIAFKLPIISHTQKILFRYCMCYKNRHHQSTQTRNRQKNKRLLKVKNETRLKRYFFIILLGYKSELMNRIIKMKMTIKSE